MITRIEALNYRCLRYVAQDLGPFHVLVGPNASGKTTFLDVVAFLGRMVSDGPEAAVIERTQNPEDLAWGHRSGGFELAIEADIPHPRAEFFDRKKLDTIRYEVAIDFLSGVEGGREIAIRSEKALLLKRVKPSSSGQQELFPAPPEPTASILTPRAQGRSSKTVLNKVLGGNDNYYAETSEAGKGWAPAFKLGPRKSTLGNLPADDKKFPVTTWLRSFFRKASSSSC